MKNIVSLMPHDIFIEEKLENLTDVSNYIKATLKSIHESKEYKENQFHGGHFSNGSGADEIRMFEKINEILPSYSKLLDNTERALREFGVFFKKKTGLNLSRKIKSYFDYEANSRISSSHYQDDLLAFSKLRKEFRLNFKDKNSLVSVEAQYRNHFCAGIRNQIVTTSGQKGHDDLYMPGEDEILDGDKILVFLKEKLFPFFYILQKDKSKIRQDIQSEINKVTDYFIQQNLKLEEEIELEENFIKNIKYLVEEDLFKVETNLDLNYFDGENRLMQIIIPEVFVNKSSSGLETKIKNARVNSKLRLNENNLKIYNNVSEFLIGMVAGEKNKVLC